MKKFPFDREPEIPIVTARVYGPRDWAKIRLVFDPGSAISQIDTGIIDEIGYSAKSAHFVSSIQGPAGDSQPGYVLTIDRLIVFGITFNSLTVGAFDFDNFSKDGIDGLLGFDLIKQLHLEMNGPKGELNIF